MKNYDRLWAALATARISTLNELVHNIASDDRLSAGEALLLPGSDSEAAPLDDHLPATPSIIHRPPTVPLMLDGQLLQDSKEITSYNGTALCYTPIRINSGVALAAFTSRAKMIAEVGRLSNNFNTAMMRSQSEHICTSNPDGLAEQVCFFSDINEEGDVKCLAPGRAYSDLTRVGRNLVTWWYTADWNDVISSVSWCRWDVSLYEHINYGGSQLWLRAGCNTPNLVELGWNDRASSIVNWGRRF
ncbi:MAG: hypothetical protein R3C14_48780 [Caldilineaceae bacterium]